MAQYVALTRADGTVAIMLMPGSPTPQDIAAEIAKMPAQGFVSHRLISAAQLPATRAFREAWTDIGSGPIQHHMPRAREVLKARLRAERAPALAALDVEYQRADEANDTSQKARIAAVKQRLRDITDDPRIKAAESVEALEAVQLEGLRG